uniref:threonine--tRNA ligase n=1 Tax=Strigamia maritima TaxID=126957 RepID=T1JCT2_STRMM
MTKYASIIQQIVTQPIQIKIKLPDDKTVQGESWRTTPYEIAAGMSKSLADNSIVAKVNGELWDLDRPLETDCELQLLKFENEKAQQVFWHSTAHIMGEAMERIYGGQLCYGPPIESGFYYDMFIKDQHVSSTDFPTLESVITSIVKEKQPFERLEMSKEDLMEMFKYNEFKLRILREKVTTATTTVYKCGTLIDLCLGPHIRHTGKVKAFSITKNSQSYWEGKAESESLQRIYGISFPESKQLKEWRSMQDEAAKRDHRKIGKDQDLFFFHELSPGSCFFQPHGALIYNTLIEFIRNEYRKRGFQEVISPNIYNSRLWQTSGHWQHYAENMFVFKSEKQTFALKPMNCPGHCLMFDQRPRSFRELPLRIADFGVLHRDESSGTLSGLTRVRRFQQDDAHIFCTIDQISDEINECLNFLDHVYGIFGFTYELSLATRPNEFLGEINVWDSAEEQLRESLNTFGHKWTLNAEDGAFYGPKIDITIKDALGRSRQCATIQLDFQLPIRFDLKYTSDSGEVKRPVMIHRAILGSLERMIAILAENFAGKWPFWLSPRQAIIVPVASQFDSYATMVRDEIHNAGFVCDVSLDSGITFNRKIRNAQLSQYNFIFVVGQKEVAANTLNVRTRDNKVHGERSKVKIKEKSGDEKSSVKELNPLPVYIDERNVLWNQLMTDHVSIVQQKSTEPIQIKLPDGKTVQGESWRSTPYQIASGISKGLADNSIVAKVNGELWDLDRPLETDCELQLLKFDDEEAQKVFWHSTAHIMGEAMERIYGGHLCYGPPIEDGFYYDMFIKEQQVSNMDFPAIENVMKTIVKEKQPFERLEMSKEDLMEMFKYNEFKLRILKEKVKTATTTVYKCGSLIDLCRGPHVRNTAKVKAFSIIKNSASYWEGNAQAESLQRIYGISFPDSKQLKEWQKFQEEAAKRDHRKIGREQELFFFHELSPGSCFFQPRGAHIYNILMDFIRGEYRKRGFQEVISPNIYNSRLWQTSGHWQHYAENMFSFESEKETFALKPMNCPGHCLMFDHRPRSFRELPLRMADFGVLHRNELSGALTGLTRVRRFQQDDAHIFCTIDHINEEIISCLNFLSFIYGIFGFTFELNLATRPKDFLGEIAMWDQAEKQLTESLNTFGYPWKLNPEDGAFYGPKIDITIKDALRRRHQCATIQLDFQLPIQFDLNYITDSGEKKRPVIIHRAILGSLERMIAILTENFGGKWPFWLSPRQAIVIPVASQFDAYSQSVRDDVFKAGFVCDVDLDPGTTMNKKIRTAQLAQYNFIFVIGEKEVAANTINIRTRDNKVHGEMSVQETIARFEKLKQEKTLNSEEAF